MNSLSDLTKEVLYDLYVTEKLPSTKIGKLYNCSYATVLERLRKYDIPVRKSCESRHKGARTIAANGYVLITIPEEHRQVLEHRYVMEQHLGRKLKRTEHVHHIDHDKTNNDISNLRLCNGDSEHKLLHREFSTEEMLEWVNNFYKENGRYPFYYEFTAFNYDTIRSRFGNAEKMIQAVSDYVGVRWLVNGRKPKEEYFEKLYQYEKVHGKLPRVVDYSKEVGVNYDMLLKKCGSASQFKDDYDQYKKEVYNIEPKKRITTKEKILSLMYNYEKEHNGFPPTNDWTKEVKCDYSYARKTFKNAKTLWKCYEEYKASCKN